MNVCLPPVARFVYELHQLHSSALTSSQQVGVALQCVCEAGDRVRGLRERVEREGVVLGERSEACDKLRTQIGQDTAILKEHNKLLAKQRQRIAHLKKVRTSATCITLCRKPWTIIVRRFDQIVYPLIPLVWYAYNHPLHRAGRIWRLAHSTTCTGGMQSSCKVYKYKWVLYKLWALLGNVIAAYLAV